jgi:hypothetical protein
MATKYKKCEMCGCDRICTVLKKAKLDDTDMELWRSICVTVEKGSPIKWESFVKLSNLYRRTCE